MYDTTYVSVASSAQEVRVFIRTCDNTPNMTMCFPSCVGPARLVAILTALLTPLLCGMLASSYVASLAAGLSLTAKQPKRHERARKYVKQDVLIVHNVTTALHEPLKQMVKCMLFHQQLADNRKDGENSSFASGRKSEVSWKFGCLNRSQYQAARSTLTNADSGKHNVTTTKRGRSNVPPS